MAITDAPDGTLWVQQVSVVVSAPVPPEPANEVAAGDIGRYSGSATTYQELARWTVTAGKLGELKEVSMVTDEWEKTRWKLVIGATTVFTDLALQAILTLPFFDLRLAAATAVTLSVKSSDGTAIVADGSITGKEIG